MAPKIQLEISLLPKEFGKGPNGGNKKVTTELVASTDFDLTWIDFFKKQKNNEAVFKQILAKANYTISDRRIPSSRKIWKLNAKIRNFIDSFDRNLQTYKADLGNSVPNTVNSPSGNRSAQQHQQVNPRTKGRIVNVDISRNNSNIRAEGRPNANESRSNTRSQVPGPPNAVPPSRSPLKRKLAESNNVAPPKTSRVGQGGSEIRISAGGGAQIQNGRTQRGCVPPNLPPIQFDLDAASMASTQDSQIEELEAEGIVNEEIKSKFIAALVKHVDNSTLLRMRNELRNVVGSGRYLKGTRYFPEAAQLFNILLYQLNN